MKINKCFCFNKSFLNNCAVICYHLPEFYNTQHPRAEEEEWTMVIHNRWQQLFPEFQTAAPRICLIWTARNRQLCRGLKKTCWWFYPLDLCRKKTLEPGMYASKISRSNNPAVCQKMKKNYSNIHNINLAYINKFYLPNKHLVKIYWPLISQTKVLYGDTVQHRYLHRRTGKLSSVWRESSPPPEPHTLSGRTGCQQSP